MGKDENKVQRDILSILDMFGYFWRTNSGGRKVRCHSCKGVPDILGVMRGGRFVGIEVKTDTGRQSDDQQIFQEAIEAVGGLYILARDVETVVEILQASNIGHKPSNDRQNEEAK